MIMVFCSFFISWGQEAAFTATVSLDSVLLGNFIEVTFTAKNIPNAKIEPPAFEGFDLVSGPNYSSYTQIINGQTTQTLSYSYILKPKDIGQYFIAPAYTQKGEETFSTAPIEINVYPNPDNIVQKPPKKKNTKWLNFGWSEEFPSIKKPKKKKKKKKKKRKVYRL